MSDTKIEWAEKSWNPVIGCSRVSESCKNCYAERRAWLLAHNELIYPCTQEGYWKIVNKGRWNGNTVRFPWRLDEPLHWRKPKIIFVCSMGDLFHESVPDEWIIDVIARILLSQQHKFIILTKRAERMRDYFLESIVPTNLVLGVSCENQARLEERVPILLETPAAKRVVSLEPLLGKINLWDYISKNGKVFHSGGYTDSLDWIICGIETGTGRRPCELQWIESIVGQCWSAGVPVFVKKIEVGGRIVSDFEQFPETVKFREYPFNPEA